MVAAHPAHFDGALGYAHLLKLLLANQGSGPAQG